MTLLPHLVAALLGLVLGWRSPRYRRTAAGLALLLVIRFVRDISRIPRADGLAERLAAYVAGQPVPPYAGLARWSWAVEQVATVAWGAVVAGLVWGELKDETPGHDSGAGVSCRSLLKVLPVARSRLDGALGRALGSTLSFLAACASVPALFLAYPTVRGRPVELALVALFLIALAAQLVAVTRYTLRWRRPDAARGVALVLAIGSIADLVMWMRGHPTRDWSAAGPTGVLIWAVIGGVEAWALAAGWKRR